MKINEQKKITFFSVYVLRTWKFSNKSGIAITKDLNRKIFEHTEQRNNQRKLDKSRTKIVIVQCIKLL